MSWPKLRNVIKTTYEVKLRRMLALLFKIIRQLFLKVFKSAHRLTLAGRVLNKVASESWKVPLTKEISIKGALLERSVRFFSVANQQQERTKGAEKRTTKNMQLFSQYCCKKSWIAILVRFTTHIKPVLQQIRLLTGLNMSGKTRNISFQLVLHQCCKTSFTLTFLLPVLAKFNLKDRIFHSKYIVSDWLFDLHNSSHLSQPHSHNQYHWKDDFVSLRLYLNAHTLRVHPQSQN